MDRLEETDGSQATMVQSRGAHGALVLSITGEIDLSNVEELREAIEPIIAQERDHIVFDLSALRFMDSSGIALFLAVAERVGTVELHNPTPVIRRVIEVTGLSHILRLDP
jgi:anti-anti-sigma factor